MYRYILTLGLLILALADVHATHNRAGEITYEQIGELTIRATITTYTRTSSFAADRDSLELTWGDGTSEFVLRSNGDGRELPNDIKVNYYIAEHTYPTRGTYKLSVTDPNRIAGILNIDFPNSVNIQFYIETTFTLLDVRFQGRNNSAVLLQPPIDYACVDEIFTHNPNAYDPDGDSLSYELIPPKQEDGVDVPNYVLPDLISPGPENIVTLDPITGDFVWDSPKVQGEFNVTFKINEYREGVLINSIIRDMQILVRTCLNENTPPNVETVEELCVVAGDLVTFDVVATDEQTTQQITLTALGGPFEVEDSPAEFVQHGTDLFSPGEGTFTWQTTCEHVSREFYQIVFKAEDDFFESGTGLATLKTVRIKVIAPPPEDVIVEKVESSIRISWKSPYECEDAGLFQGFSVWRKLSTGQVPDGPCDAGLEGTGYEEIIFLTTEKEGDRFVAYDAEVGEAEIYCYRVLGEFANLTDSGNPFNKVESIPSEEGCVRFERKDPLITNVSVIETDDQSGQVEVRWILPDPDDVDTLIRQGPYGIQLYRATGLTGLGLTPVNGAFFSSATFGGLQDTVFIDAGLNTTENAYSYRVDFTVNGSEAFSASDPASSVFLSASGTDEGVILTWSETVPWLNFEYDVYMADDAGDFNLVGTSEASTFTVDGLGNGREYCFLVEARGRYGLREVNEPLINFSQEVCAIPVDGVAPCPPVLSVITVCDQPVLEEVDILTNSISFGFNSASCERAQDIAFFNVYLAPSPDESFEILASVDLDENTFEHTLADIISGCYTVTAVDSSGNEGEFSNVVCVDNCPLYELGNAFTPNGDNFNDLFVPRINRFIDRVELEIYNRWGQVVFTTDDPEINWDGVGSNGRELADGTYFYTCRVFENRVTGVTESDEILSGYIQLVRGE